jgi:peptidoglycan/xylan/chitin deacetylase (PgdA/CDA1 family)
VSGRSLRWLASLLHRPAGDSSPRLVIVRHHRVHPAGARPLYRLGVGLDVLRAQLATLARHGLTPITVSEGLAWLEQAASGRRVALTFDDGYADNVRHALPLLAGAGARATFFLTAGLIEQRRAPWWDELVHLLTSTREARLEHQGRRHGLERDGDRIRALRALLPAFRAAPAAQRSLLAELAGRLRVETRAPCELATWEECASLVAAGMEVGAHTLTHPFLSTLPAAGQAAEIAGSFDLIERRLGLRPRGLAYPGGDHDAWSLEAARDAAAAWAVTTRAGDNRPDTPRFALLRRGLSEGACLGPGGRFSARLAMAELDGAFDALRAWSGRLAAAAAETAG